MKHVGNTFRAKEKLQGRGLVPGLNHGVIAPGGAFVVTAEMYELYDPDGWLRVGVCELVGEGEIPFVDDPDATDAAVKLAAEFNVSLSSVTGTGSGGRITFSDVQAVVDSAAVSEGGGEVMAEAEDGDDS